MLATSYRAATSKTAQRTVLNTILVTTASAFLYALAAIAYILFYNAYLPDQVTTLPIHLQYNYGPNPYGVAPLSNLKDYQAYDISLSLTLPRSPPNLDRGNFMVALYLLDRPGTSTSPATDSASDQQLTTLPPTIFPPPDPRSYLSTRRVLYTSHRPALVPYTDPVVSLASRLLFLPGHIFFPSSFRASSTSLTVSLAEKVSFPSLSPGGGTTTGKRIPASLFLELQAGQDLRVSDASVTVTAQLSGLRWLMYTYRVASFLAGTAAFWGCEVVCMALAWGVLAVFVFGGTKEEEDQQREPDSTQEGEKGQGIGDEGDMSDTERTFPTTGRQPPLKYESVKEEDDGVSVGMAEMPLAPGVEADDEDEDGDGGGWRDSGIGTGLSDAGAASLRRRGSAKGAR
jgi:hypothetical protein